MRPQALDTSVAVPLVMVNHRAHAEVVRWSGERQLVLSGHALAETYSVLTRLPGDARLSAADAARLLSSRFGPPLLLEPEVVRRLPDVLARCGVAGGAVYDALVGLAAVAHDADLATRDRRALSTYEAVGARVVLTG